MHAAGIRALVIDGGLAGPAPRWARPGAVRFGECDVVRGAPAGLALARARRYDVALVDVQFDDRCGLEVAAALRRIAPSLRVAFLTSGWDSVPIRAALDAGALGTIARDAALEDFEAAVCRLAAGHEVELACAEPERVRFGPYDREILRLAAEGLTNAQIGARVHLAPGTVKHHLRELFAALGVRNRAGAVHAARRLGVIPPPALGTCRVSPREREILDALRTGATNGEIASALALSPNTVKQHTSSIYRKLGVRNRAQATSRAEALLGS
jgi:two-component system response regulator DesR